MADPSITGLAESLPPVDPLGIATAAGFVPAFTTSFGAILVTEIGDRTFFVAAIMAMRFARLVVLGGAYSALVLMTLISCIFGFAALKMIPKMVVHVGVVCLMFVFGFKMLHTGYTMSDEVGFDEMGEVEQEIEAKVKKDPDVETGLRGSSSQQHPKLRSALSIALQAFTLTFLGEWGDRSQLATIALAASNSTLGVFVGSCLGHMLCTTFAVVGGRLIANYVTERTVQLVGGVLFLLFGVWALYWGGGA